ncbi:MAG TPA: branched-chain amino acid ABC transporter permease [Gaiellaceae bacterium]|nr:branched-chain amino acid ABC transporter permease [Gaiellaceae bacterium]
MVQLTLPRPDVRRITWQVALRRLPLTLTLVAIVFAVVYILFVTIPAPLSGNGSWRTTTFGSAVHDPVDFAKTFLDAITFAGLLFVVASGFTLIFGLMRAVNMAHGSLFLLGGYIAFDLQQYFSNAGGFALEQVPAWEWFVPAIVAAVAVAGVGLLMQQLFLRWTQGQDLRQALITIAVSIILADQMLQHWPLQDSLAWPAFIGPNSFVHIGGIVYAWSRLFILGVALVVGMGLYLWLQKTRTGMVIRAGVDDRHMVSALGVNIQLTFALAFVVGSALAGFGGAMGGAFSSLAPGVDGQWLLNSLVVVIIGGMGSLGGAAAGAILYAFVATFSAAYLPTSGLDCCTEYSPIFTFVLLIAVLALRPLGLFGRPA